MAEDKIQKNANHERKNAIHERNVTESCLLALGYKNEEIIDLMNNHFNTKDCANTNLMNILKVLTDK
jgi:Holliday junction resolvasome RuvABC DNA-binding subunit